MWLTGRSERRCRDPNKENNSREEVLEREKEREILETKKEKWVTASCYGQCVPDSGCGWMISTLPRVVVVYLSVK